MHSRNFAVGRQLPSHEPGQQSDATLKHHEPAVRSEAIRAYESEFGAGGQRLGCNFLLDDGSLLFVNESEITSEIETLMASLGAPTGGLKHSDPVAKDKD